MADINLEYKLVNGKLEYSYYDKHNRDVGIEFFEQAKKLIFIHGTEKGIDLLLKSNPLIGAECEGDGWDGDYWKHYKSKLFFPFKTLNFPHRKFHYWNLQFLSDKIEYFKDVFNEGWDKNWYFRMNVQMDQIIVVSAETILDTEKRLFKKDGKTKMSNKIEDWLCFKQEDVETWNKQPNGIWELNGKYHGPSPEESEQIRCDRVDTIARLKRERTKNRVRELNIFNK